mmetsp:Transcript_22377/g.72164  ORF Transcript_22377/g.72164 Transcript_22377/m.72164 type:complete len:219 (+) Transcript_22377:59-715(+)
MGEQFEQFDPLSRRFAPSVPRPKGGLVNVFDEEAERFGSLTGVDRATAAIHLRAATLRGASFEEAVDRFYQNNGAHVRDENANADEAAVERQKTRKELDQSDSALARALAEEDRESKGLSHAFDDVVAQLEDMGFDKALALRAVEAEKDLEKATNFCLRGEKNYNYRRTNFGVVLATATTPTPTPPQGVVPLYFFKYDDDDDTTTRAAAAAAAAFGGF